MKQLLILPLMLTLCWNAQAQFRLDVAGNAKIEGRLELSVGTNTFLGEAAGQANTTGSRNTFLGVAAGQANTTGFNNTFVGEDAGQANTTGAVNTFIGEDAGRANTSGDRNTFIGEDAGRANTSGNANTFVGQDAGRANTTGTNNTFVGEDAGQANTIGDHNTFVGQYAGQDNTIGDSNTFVGEAAGAFNTTGTNNTFIGEDAGQVSTTGFSDTFIGEDAGFSNTDGDFNTFVGEAAGFFNTTGDRNTFVGENAGDTNTTGSDLEAFGAGAGASLTGDTENAAAFGSRSVFTNSHQVTLGNVATSTIQGYVNWGSISDERYKHNIREEVKGLAFILNLRPVQYSLDAKKLDTHLRAKSKQARLDSLKAKGDKEVIADFKAAEAAYDQYLQSKSDLSYTGFLAQEVEQAAQAADFDFSGVVAPQHEQDHYTLRYAEFVVPLVKAVQELNEEKDAEIAELKKQNAELEARLAKIEGLLEQLTIDNSAINNSTTDYRPSTSTIVLTDAKLEQNQPNPFDGSTTVRYFIPQDVQQAELRVTDLTGKVIKSVVLPARGTGQTTLEASTLGSGTYQYSLFLDGKLLETKQMVLTKN